MRFATILDLEKRATKTARLSSDGPRNVVPAPAGTSDSSASPATSPLPASRTAPRPTNSIELPTPSSSFKPGMSDGVQGPAKPGLVPAQLDKSELRHKVAAEESQMPSWLTGSMGQKPPRLDYDVRSNNAKPMPSSASWNRAATAQKTVESRKQDPWAPGGSEDRDPKMSPTVRAHGALAKNFAPGTAGQQALASRMYSHSDPFSQNAPKPAAGDPWAPGGSEDKPMKSSAMASTNRAPGAKPWDFATGKRTPPPTENLSMGGSTSDVATKTLAPSILQNSGLGEVAGRAALHRGHRSRPAPVAVAPTPPARQNKTPEQIKQQLAGQQTDSPWGPRSAQAAMAGSFGKTSSVGPEQAWSKVGLRPVKTASTGAKLPSAVAGVPKPRDGYFAKTSGIGEWLGDKAYNAFGKKAPQPTGGKLVASATEPKVEPPKTTPPSGGSFGSEKVKEIKSAQGTMAGATKAKSEVDKDLGKDWMPGHGAMKTAKPGAFFTPGAALPSGERSGAVSGGGDNGWS